MIRPESVASVNGVFKFPENRFLARFRAGTFDFIASNSRCEDVREGAVGVEILAEGFNLKTRAVVWAYIKAVRTSGGRLFPN